MLHALQNDAEPDMRSQAAAALGTTASVEVVPALVTALADDDSLTREEAAAALGRFGPAARDAVDRLANVARTDEVACVRRAALAALRRVGASDVADRAEADAQPSAPPDALEGLLARLDSADPRIRAETSWPLGKYGAEAAPALSAVVRQLRYDDDPDARWGASWVVGRIGPAALPAAADVAASAREDPDPDVRANAARALGCIRASDAVVIETLIDALADEGAALLREEAALALARIGPPARAAVVALRSRLKDRAQLVRVQASVAIARIEGI
jgi:HEAT repeat protein